MGFSFLKKKPKQGIPGMAGGPQVLPPSGAPPSGIPVDHVISMRQQGLSNNQIIQTLTSQGFSPEQVFDAMKQADIKGIVEPTHMAPYDMAAPANPMGGPPGTMPPGAHPPGMPPGAHPPGPAPPGMPPHQAAPKEDFEEIAESIVAEKWHEFNEALSSLNDWKEKTDERLAKLEQSMEDLKTEMSSIHKGIIAKIGEYDESLMNVGTEIKAMEKVFKKVLPTFTDNVNELSRVAKTLGGKAPKAAPPKPASKKK